MTDFTITTDTGQQVGTDAVFCIVPLKDSGMHQVTHVIGQSNPVTARNYTDEAGNPAGGYAHGPGMCIAWQDGPRGKEPDGTLGDPNGAFVEDALVAAVQRLTFFQASKYAHEANADAIGHIIAAIEALHARANERANRGVLGQHAV